MDETLTQLATAAASVLALVLSLVNLYLQRRDLSPRLRIRVRYEYRANAPEGDTGRTPPRIHDDSQEGLYLLLGDFLREHHLAYPEGFAVVRFALSNEGQRELYLDAIRLVVLRSGHLGNPMVLDLSGNRVLSLDLAGGVANILGSGEGLPVQLAPGDGVGYKFELVRLANTLRREGYMGNARLALEATDRLGNVYRCPFDVNTDLWAYPENR